MRKVFFIFLSVFITTPVWGTPDFLITCDDTYGNGCNISGNYTNFIIDNCTKVKTLNKEAPIIINLDKTGIPCNRQINAATKKPSNCESASIQTRYFTDNNTRYFAVFCSDAYLDTLSSKYSDSDDTDWSYQKKKCVGSGGEWNEDAPEEKCTCPNTETTLTDGECLCTTGITKYLVGGNCSTTGGACTSTGGTPYDKSETDTDYCSCPDTMEQINIRPKSAVQACQCKKGYQYRDPMRRWEGCVVIDETITISGTIYNYNVPNETLSGVTLESHDTNSTNTKTTTTSNEGKFQLADVPNTAYIKISLTGFKTQIHPATELKNATLKLVPSILPTTISTSAPSSEQLQDNNDKCTTSGGTPNNNECTCNINDNLIQNTDKTKCICADGFTRQSDNDKCEQIKPTGDNNSGGNGAEQSGGGDDAQKAELAEKLKSARDALAAAKEKENSWANRGLGAASTAATGLGAMQLAEGISEKINDAAAEKEMRAYIETMKCDYGGGQQITMSNEEITLPGGNELLEYYTEYKSLADNLKQTKTALGLRSGIESEVLYDRAQSGLYQYASTGKTGGGETSLFRALTDAESADATAWAKQKEESSKKLTAGGIATTVGVGGGIVGNYLINSRDKKE